MWLQHLNFEKDLSVLISGDDECDTLSGSQEKKNVSSMPRAVWFILPC